MDPDRWQRVTAVFDAALLREPSERAAYVAEACADDSGLVADVQALLAGHERARGASTWNGTRPMGATTATLEAGAQVGPYIIHGLIGLGGMGEVYRARDSKLGREVAIKILPPAFIADPERVARFEREARVLASLNHPHIGAIYGLEEANRVRALVLELVDGETLADRLQRGSIPVVESLAIARQIADGLDAAHEKAIIHRDLKPANIKIASEGRVKILDFGISKLATGDAAGANLTQSPTVTVDRTRHGVMLGTAAYMSPEQARGLPVDKRTDIWAFGCVLYEMLVGRPAFARATVTDTLAAIVDQDVNWDALPETTPPAALRLLRRCLEKDRKRRFESAADARLEIDEASAEPSPRSRVVVGKGGTTAGLFGREVPEPSRRSRHRREA